MICFLSPQFLFINKLFCIFPVKLIKFDILRLFEPRPKKTSSGFPIRSDTNPAVKPQKMVRSLKFPIYEVEGLYYLCSENKGADQLCGYCTADLRLCFCICKNRFSHDAAHMIMNFLVVKCIYYLSDSFEFDAS